MKPYYQDSHCTIYHGDCREILPGLPKVDHVITDPPYGIGFAKYETHKDDPKFYRQLLQDSIFEAEKKARLWLDVRISSSKTLPRVGGDVSSPLEADRVC